MAKGSDKKNITDRSENDHQTPPPITQSKTTKLTFANHTRYIILFLSTAALTLVVGNSLALNFTIICMPKTPSLATPPCNDSDQLKCLLNNNATNANNTETDALFTLNERSALFSATALGTLIGSLPITYLTANYGFRKVFVTYCMINGLATLAFPLAVSFGFIPVFIMRLLQGIAVSTSFVAMGAISAEWSPTKTTGTYLSLISCHLQFGPIITMPLAGELCTSWGWQSLYYILGTVSVIVFTLFLYFYRDSPRFQRNVSTKELRTIESGKVHIATEKKEKQHVPYRAILTDKVVWGLLATSTSGLLAFYVIQIFGPIYLNKALKLDIEDTGIAAALPFALSCIVKMVAGPFSDFIPCLSDKTLVILFSSISQVMMAGCYAALNFLPGNQIGLIQVFFNLVIVFSGLNAVGSVKAAQLATQHFCHVIMAWTSMFASVLNLILPFIVRVFAADNTTEQWGRIFISIGALLIVANVFFILTINVQPRPWTADDFDEKAGVGNNNLRQKIHSISAPSIKTTTDSLNSITTTTTTKAEAMKNDLTTTNNLEK